MTARTTRSSHLALAAALTLGSTLMACSSSDTNKTGNGGSSGTGSGGHIATGGSNGTGSAGTTGSGGTTGSAGTTGNGGSTGSAGTTGSGGTTGSAGTTGSGGSTGSAGTTGSAGSTGSGGSGSSSCVSSTFAVAANGLVTMPAKNSCWSGYAYTYQDAFGTMAMPVSPTPGFAMCGTGCMLKMTGTLAAVAGTSYTYAGIGFALGQSGDTKATVVPKGTGLTFTFTNGTTGGAALRAQLTDGTKTWCATLTTSPATVPYSSFSVNCYNTPPGAAYAMDPITDIQVQLAGSTTASTIDLTLTSVTEN